MASQHFLFRGIVALRHIAVGGDVAFQYLPIAADDRAKTAARILAKLTNTFLR